MALSTFTENKLFITGYTAKGVVYSLIGIFAIAGVIGGASSSNSGPKAVIQWIGTNPFGRAGLEYLLHTPVLHQVAIADVGVEALQLLKAEVGVKINRPVLVIHVEAQALLPGPARNTLHLLY